MSDLKPGDFDEFFRELHGRGPFPWQERLAEKVCAGRWPDYLGLPTASGKTACIEIAVFALAFQAGRPAHERTAARRMFFAVDRRVIVDEAYERALKLARKLAEAEGGVVKTVADRLRSLSGDDSTPPLDCCQLRGGIYRDDSWVRSPTQATIIASTVDQVGSRLLFRGYGVSEFNWPIHAGLIANDALIILDEAHCARAFSQTLAAVRRYRGAEWAHDPLRTPFAVVQMTATPPPDAEGEIFGLKEEDKGLEKLGKRLYASKPTRLLEATKAKGKDYRLKLADALVEQAVQLASERNKATAILVNRVATARLVRERLSTALADKELPGRVELVVGRMRPIDRDVLTSRLKQWLASGVERATDAAPIYVVATQCLEVGADFDFDAMVSECASIDALRQRFGRLNRMGRDIDARGCIVIASGQVLTEEELDKLGGQSSAYDPVYGSALARTWNWLCQNGVPGEQAAQQVLQVDMGIESDSSRATVSERLNALREEDPKRFDRLHAPAPDAPIMLPAHVDCWVQTSPRPVPEPDVSLFLHGPERGMPEVQVVWRADLEPMDDPAAQQEHWTQTVSLCPPTSPECMPVPISVFRDWVSGQDEYEGLLSDVEGIRMPLEENGEGVRRWRRALAWRGLERSELISHPSHVRPGDTLVLPACAGGWEAMGYIPGPREEQLGGIDLAEAAFLAARDKACLRLHPKLMEAWPVKGTAFERIRNLIVDSEAGIEELRSSLRDYRQGLGDVDEPWLWLPEVIDALKLGEGPGVWRRRFRAIRYPAVHRGEVEHESAGLVIQSRQRVGRRKRFAVDEDADSDELSGVSRVPLKQHVRDVEDWVHRFVARLGLDDLAEAFRLAAERHDLGKADPRFQALLLGGDRIAAWFSPTLWAKGEEMAATRSERRYQWQASGLPDGFRHELLSLQVAASTNNLSEAPPLRDLTLHLIAAHHGRCRPFAPVVFDDNPEPIDLSPMDIGVYWSIETRKQIAPAHQLDSGVPARFWALVRQYGWWGLAYLEAIFRLSDWFASEKEQRLSERGSTNGDLEAVR